MSQTDAYEYVAMRKIMHGGVTAFQPGDPVPGDTVDEQGYEIGSDVVLRKNYKPDAQRFAGRAPVRGQMPDHLKADDKPAEKIAAARKASSDK
jgi:hypothetical protein